jgi:Tfp pilus assembly protein PilO
MSLIVPIILIIASFATFFAYIDPTYMEIKDLTVKKEQYDQALTNSKALQAERDKFREKYNNMPEGGSMANPGKAELAKALPDNIDNVRLLIDLDDMAKTYGMRIRNFRADVSDQKQTIGVDQTPYGTLTLSFSTTAAYNTFLAFIRDLEHSLRIMDVSSIQFSASDTNQLYDYSVTLKTYWLK